MKKLLYILAMTSSFVSTASWQLIPEQSSLNFISIKNTTVAETHQFSNLKGTWSDQGSVQIQIPVSSLETHIPIRNQRMLDYVLKAKQYPEITVQAELKPDSIASLAVGKSMLLTLPIAVNIAGETVNLLANIRLLKITASSIQATTESPLILNVNTANLSAGVDKLQQLAQLNAISKLVPVTFSVNFNTTI
ncbi:YceI family protein [Rheinheimera sp. MMS21-TC3]|uniref:YceI family protein n=1 Tax=Rheinheimera sp. MMS21-TC3 TaxID=3072790 RepID=UPI0028C390CD|nr:YceI family protein [Rheinheimera sp. MMS21-TC3]WNO61246.1 YceI family protein [Rheinheimera sp. MMS21-TC3]